jgi:hypothetical protein
MWAAWIVAAVALWFLIALLRESAPSVCCWVVPVRLELGRKILEVRNKSYSGDERRDPECNRRVSNEKLLENENHAKEQRTSALIVFDVGPASASLGWCSIDAKRGSVFRKYRL